MKYIVMESDQGYAIVLDEDGRFLKVANLNYQVGDYIDDVIVMEEKRQPWYKTKTMSYLSMVCCLCLVCLTSWYYIFNPYGEIRIQINPDIQLFINRFDFVIDVQALNDDGKTLIDGYDYSYKNVDTVTKELTEQAKVLGYLSDGGKVHVSVTSNHEKWKQELEMHLHHELDEYAGDVIEMIYELKEEADDDDDEIDKDDEEEDDDHHEEDEHDEEEDDDKHRERNHDEEDEEEEDEEEEDEDDDDEHHHQKKKHH